MSMHDGTIVLDSAASVSPDRSAHFTLPSVTVASAGPVLSHTIASDGQPVHVEFRLAFQRTSGDADVTFLQLNLEGDTGTNFVYLSQGPNGNSFAVRSDYVDGGTAGGNDVLVGAAGSAAPRFTSFRIVIAGTSVQLFVDGQGPTDQSLVLDIPPKNVQFFVGLVGVYPSQSASDVHVDDVAVDVVH
jgi:hypothetical protein